MKSMLPPSPEDRDPTHTRPAQVATAGPAAGRTPSPAGAGALSQSPRMAAQRRAVGATFGTAAGAAKLPAQQPTEEADGQAMTQPGPSGPVAQGNGTFQLYVGRARGKEYGRGQVLNLWKLYCTNFPTKVKSVAEKYRAEYFQESKDEAKSAAALTAKFKEESAAGFASFVKGALDEKLEIESVSDTVVKVVNDLADGWAVKKAEVLAQEAEKGLGLVQAALEAALEATDSAAKQVMSAPASDS